MVIYRDRLGRGLDRGLLPYIQRINQNPNVKTTSSCSGHSGHPYVEVHFRTPQAARFYVSLLLRARLHVFKLERDYYIDIPGTDTPTNVYSRADYNRMARDVNYIAKPIGREGDPANPYRGPASGSQSTWFWQTVTQILSSPFGQAPRPGQGQGGFSNWVDNLLGGG